MAGLWGCNEQGARDITIDPGRTIDKWRMRPELFSAPNRPMTVRQTLEEKLVTSGLWGDEAKRVVTGAEEAEPLKAMHGRWDDDANTYPAAMLTVVWMSVREHAIKYLRAEAPKHFALAVLEDE